MEKKSMSKRRMDFIINLGGNLKRRARGMGKALERMGNQGTRSMNKMERSAKKLDRRMARIQKGMTRRGKVIATGITAAVGIGVSRAIANVGTLEERVTQLGVNAKLGGAGLQSFTKNLKEQVQAAATNKDFGGVDSKQILAGIEAIVEKTGDLKFAQANIENITKAIRATGAQGSDIGGILSEIQKMNVKEPKKVMAILEGLTAQGKEGAFVLKDLASLGERVFAAYGPKNIKDVKEMGAALQLIRMGTGSSEQATTAFEALLRTLTDKKKLKQLQSLKFTRKDGTTQTGIDVFDKQAAKQGKEVLNPITDIMVQLVQASQGKKSNLSVILDAEAMRALNDMANKFNKGIDIQKPVNALKNIDGAGVITRDAKEMTQVFNARKQAVTETLSAYADKRLSGGVKKLSAMMESLDPATVNHFLDAIVLATAALAGLAVSAKLGGIGGKLGGVGGKVAGVAGKAVPVFIAGGVGYATGTAISNFYENTIRGGKGSIGTDLYDLFHPKQGINTQRLTHDALLSSGKTTAPVNNIAGKVNFDVTLHDKRSTLSTTIKRQPSGIKLNPGNMVQGMVGGGSF
jgi:hypothetical protein